jgi:hypothetical protein
MYSHSAQGAKVSTTTVAAPGTFIKNNDLNHACVNASLANPLQKQEETS